MLSMPLSSMRNIDTTRYLRSLPDGAERGMRMSENIKEDMVDLWALPCGDKWRIITRGPGGVLQIFEDGEWVDESEIHFVLMMRIRSKAGNP